jgi:hypothetical protein
MPVPMQLAVGLQVQYLVQHSALLQHPILAGAVTAAHSDVAHSKLSGFEV